MAPSDTPSMATNDHVVPQMYLRRFAQARSAGHYVGVAKAEDPDSSFVASVRNVGAESGFYWGTTPSGEPHHEMENFLSSVEDAGARAFRKILDGGGPFDDAFPARWPTAPDARLAIAWWLAAQILRTRRQRDRLSFLSNSSGAPVPSGLARANMHLGFITRLVAPVAQRLWERPWAFGFADACLVTSDNPVSIINGQDRTDQLDAVDFWDVFVPLDPHRCLYLPGRSLQKRMRVRSDHRMKLHSGLAFALNEVTRSTATRHVFFHPDHDSRSHLDSRIPRPSVEEGDAAGPSFVVTGYEIVGQGLGVHRKWLDAHPAASMQPGNQRGGDREWERDLEHALKLLDEDSEGWERRRGASSPEL